MKSICLICLMIPVMLYSQVADDFSDGNFTVNPQWVGDTLQFEVNQEGRLHLKSQGSDTSVLLTGSENFPDAEWSFWMKLSFNTSANNYARIYLISDTPDLFSAGNGYFIQAGGGDDSIFIIRQQGISQKKIYCFRSYKTMHPTNTLRFKITRNSEGMWTAMIDTTGGKNYFTDGSFFDNSTIQAHWFGVYCRYTSSNAAKFYFDDFYAGPVIHDTISPSIISVEMSSEKVIRVGFSEAVEKSSAETVANYMISPGGMSPDSAVLETQQPVISLFLHDPLPAGVFGSLSVRNVADVAGNRMNDTLVPVCYYRPKALDVLIHEIMADPDPPVELPNGEYAELYNRTTFPINLKGWSFSFGSYIKVFPSLIIPPKGYLIVAKDSAFIYYGECAFLFTSSSSLSNEGTSLVLKDPLNHVIHSISYSPDWFKGSYKGEGGWSLEMTDPLNPCGCGENWGPSKDPKGGTPGRSNSTYKPNPDLNAPVLLRAVISDSACLEVYFSEKMDSTSMLFPFSWIVSQSNGLEHPDNVEPVAPEFSSVKLVFNKAFKRGISYTLRVTGGLKDCAGNPCDTMHQVRFAFPDSVEMHDIVINEILPDAAVGGARFVELFNRSEKIIDLQTLAIANGDTSMGRLPGATPLFSSGFLLFPGDYIALTSNPEDIINRYHPATPSAVVFVQGFPAFGDDSDTVVLARKDNFMIVDRMCYDPGMQYPLLATAEGVSLERTNPDMPSGDRGNWHSAAETAGFGTPGYMNSHYVAPEATEKAISIEPGIFTPDNDGLNDLLTITIHENNPDDAVGIDIYNSKGLLVNHLVNNMLLGREGVFIWDGMTEERNKAPVGIYILLIEIIRPDGTVKRFKRTTVLGGRW
jgi:hypothetical protein